MEKQLKILNTDIAPGWELRRDAALTYFNECAIGLYKTIVGCSPEDEALESVLYSERENEDEHEFGRTVAKSMLALPWFERLGLRYTDLKNMDISEFLMLQKELIADQEQPDADTLYKTAVIGRLDDLIVSVINHTALMQTIEQKRHEG